MIKTPLRLAYEALAKVKAINCPEAVKFLRGQIHAMDRGWRDPLETPVCENWRSYCNPDGAYAYDYRIYPDSGETEEEIRQKAMCEVGYGKINSPYDCTGKPFDVYYGVNRVPMGFAVVHCWSVDI